MRRKAQFIRGINLMEVLVAFAILLLLTVVVAGSFSTFRKTQELDAAAGNIIALLNDARMKTLASENSSQYGVHFAADSASLFKGAAFVPGDPANEVYALSALVRIASTSLNGGGTDTVFERLTGETGQYGSVTLSLSGDASRTRVITVSRSGMVNKN